ncbi:hypothetical protein FACS189487_00800 [Campylobacterota bacterium]|nr:hypothetical protein FACS189487_00800 [Campylobacterota bacterium]
MKKIIFAFLFCSSLMFGDLCSASTISLHGSSYVPNVLYSNSFTCSFTVPLSHIYATNDTVCYYIYDGSAMTSQDYLMIAYSEVFDIPSGPYAGSYPQSGRYSILAPLSVLSLYKPSDFNPDFVLSYFSSTIPFSDCVAEASTCTDYDNYKICTTYKNGEFDHRTYEDKLDNSYIRTNSDGTGFVRYDLNGVTFESQLYNGVFLTRDFIMPDGSAIDASMPSLYPRFYTDKSCSSVCSQHGGLFKDDGLGVCTCNDMRFGIDLSYTENFCKSYCAGSKSYKSIYYQMYVDVGENSDNYPASFSCGCTEYGADDLGIPSDIFSLCSANEECIFNQGASNGGSTTGGGDPSGGNNSGDPIDDDEDAGGGDNGGDSSGGTGGGTGGSGGGPTGGGDTGTGGSDVGGDEFTNPPVSPPAGGGNPPGGGDTGGGTGGTGGGGTGTGTGESDGSGDHDYSGQLNTIIGHLKNIDDTLNADVAYDSSSVLDGLGNEFTNFANNITAQYNNAKNIITGNFSYGFNPVNGYCSWSFRVFNHDVSMYNANVKNAFIKMRPYIIIILSLLFWFAMVKLMLFLIKGNI